MKKWQKITLTIVCILAVLAIGITILVKLILIPKATDMVIEKAVNAVVPDEYAANELIESIKAEDRDFVEEVLVDFASDKDARTNIMNYLDNNDITGLKDYAIQHLSPEQMDQALELAQKYIEFLPPEGQVMLELYLND